MREGHVAGARRGQPIDQRRLQRRRLALPALGAAALVGLVLYGLAGFGVASAEEVSPPSASAIVREGVIGEPSDVDWFSLFALVGESYTITLERRTLTAGQVSVWQPSTGDVGARVVAQSNGRDGPLIWTATESGAWRAQVSGLGGATGSYRLRIRTHNDAIGADLSAARLSAFDERGVMIERSTIDSPGDADWIAFPVASGNRYVIWSVLGSLDRLSGSLRLPGETSFTDLRAVPGGVSGQIDAERAGLAVLAVRGWSPWQVGSYAVGVTRYGSNPEPLVSLPPPRTSRLQIERIEARSVGSEAQFSFRGEWGPIRPTSGLRVWIDTDPGAGEQDEWEYLLRSDDGRWARLWSFAEESWVGAAAVGARGFDTLVMRWTGRTADERIRWQASVKNSDGTWTVSRSRLLDLPHPRPALPALWVARQRTGREDPIFDQEMRQAGVVVDLPDEALVVVLDPGHGVDPGARANGVLEAESNLAFALRIEELLEAHGVTVALTRRASGRPYLNLDFALWRPDYQVRAELAHLAKADLFVSIHSNGSPKPAMNGLEAWYYPRWNGDGLNLRLSQTLLSHVQRALTRYGYPTTSRTYDSTCWELVNGACDPIYVLAPFLLIDADVARRWGLDPSELGLSDDPWGQPSNNWLGRNDITEGEPPIDLINPQTQSGPGRIVRGNLMPTTLLELLYATHEGDAAILRDPAAREVIAQAIADGILEALGVE